MFHNIRILAARHRVRVISFVENEGEREMLRSLDGICESVTAVKCVPDLRLHWFSVMPFLVRAFSTPEMYRAVQSEFDRGKVDVLQCEYLQMAQFYRPGVVTVLTMHEALSANAYEEFRKEADLVQKLRLYYRWMATLRYEALMARKFDRVVTMTENDAEHVRSYSPAVNIRAIPIGIDPQEFQPWPEEPGRPIEVLFIGNFRHNPNVEAVNFLVTRIAPHFLDVQFVISGFQASDHFRDRTNVRCSGYVPDIRTLYRRPNTIVATPLFSGTGQRVKLLEAFSMGCPVITSSIGAAGFPVRNGVDALIADTAHDFAAALRQLISSKQLRRNLGENARQMIVRDFSWQRIGEQLLDLVEQP